MVETDPPDRINSHWGDSLDLPGPGDEDPLGAGALMCAMTAAALELVASWYELTNQTALAASARAVASYLNVVAISLGTLRR